MIFTVAFLLAGLVLTYVLIVRPVLRSHHFFDTYFVREKGLWAAFCRFRTMMAAKFAMLATVLVTIYDFLLPIASGVDWGPLTNDVPSWVWPIAMFGMAALFAYLRKITTEPSAEPAPIVG